ncbi:hypothetical protein AGABI1DRAFT_124853 [Agaricus bisporus var. burnettii JB137-S8]|uniref:Uncharacterized protein n=1 Tax=Agaricus bisporus var. burnettii (strain JB137-S8 / ATCC MYA-4627 / FGSC 10392) TaxID=597362 RepID=K5W6C3_AGABU|nr:uncharacterized protein AGABI1DRAFT_124853 [Agaricus bisporus var. burnettii JB137-S8]EKM82379.1 hypothetical protein AGABI1DRAFT_124853 [Agaricus bisporus var. burnettii JB137-S8]
MSILNPLIRIATQILPHHIDDFTLFAEFFLFSIGYLNIFIFHASAKSKRSISIWRTKSQSILPPMLGLLFPMSNSNFDYGSSTRGEEKARLRDLLLRKPDEALSKGSAPGAAEFGSTIKEELSTRSASDIDVLRTRFAGI